jgi:hypothetical protein
MYDNAAEQGATARCRFHGNAAAHSRSQPAQAEHSVDFSRAAETHIRIQPIEEASRGSFLYRTHKPQMPDGWFHVARKDFIGMSSEAIEIVNEERNWFEHRVMTQVFLAY